jgi:hypothetical protein
MHFRHANAHLHGLTKMHRPLALAHLQPRNAKSAIISGVNFTTVYPFQHVRMHHACRHLQGRPTPAVRGGALGR